MDVVENWAQICHQMNFPEDSLIGTTNESEQYKIYAVSQTSFHNSDYFHWRNWSLRMNSVRELTFLL